MLFHKKLLLLLVAQSTTLFAAGFVTPSRFGVLAGRTCASIGGPLCVSAVEDEAAEVAEPEAAAEVAEPEALETTEEAEDERDDSAPEPEEAEASEESEVSAQSPEKQRFTVFVGNLPFRKFCDHV